MILFQLIDIMVLNRTNSPFKFLLQIEPANSPFSPTIKQRLFVLPNENGPKNIRFGISVGIYRFFQLNPYITSNVPPISMYNNSGLR